jgi:hypothetical protein
VRWRTGGGFRHQGRRSSRDAKPLSEWIIHTARSIVTRNGSPTETRTSRSSSWSTLSANVCPTLPWSIPPAPRAASPRCPTFGAGSQESSPIRKPPKDGGKERVKAISKGGRGRLAGTHPHRRGKRGVLWAAGRRTPIRCRAARRRGRRARYYAGARYVLYSRPPR